MLLILALIGGWTAIVVSLSSWVGAWPVLVQAVFYLVAGIIWIAPLKPLLRWMELGTWRRRGGAPIQFRSEEPRGGKACVRTFRFRWSADSLKTTRPH